MYGSAHGEWEADGLLANAPGDRVKKSRVLDLEKALKDMVMRKKDRHDLGRVFLTNILAAGDHGGSRSKTGRISVDKFIKVLQRKLRFPLMEPEARAIFRKYGHDAQGRMPYELFARRLFEGASHVAALEGNRKEPFDASQPAQWGHQGMIKARPNKRGVYAPSDWKDECREKCKTSAAKPDAYLKLEHVYGYSGLKNTAPNLFYTKRGAVVYYTAAVGIVYEKESNTQKFFLRHDDDVQCLTIHKDRDTVATGQVGAEPVVWIWSAEGVTDRDKDAGPEGIEDPIEIKLPYGQRAVQCMGFSKTGTGDLLATVSTDNEHTINIWNWRDCRVDGVDVALATGIGKQGTPPQVNCLEWNPFAGQDSAHFSDFVTAGVNHITFWTHDGAGGLEAQGGAFGSTTQQDVLHVAYLPTGHVLAGGPNGNITIYEDKLATMEIADAHASLCKAFCMRNDGNSVMSAGGDGMVITWNIDAGADTILTKAPTQMGALKEEDGDAPALLAVDADPNDDSTFIAGSAANDIWEVDSDPKVLVEGQSALVFGIAANPDPAHSECYASGCADGSVSIWNANTRQCLKSFKIKRGYDQKPAGCDEGDHLQVKAVQFSRKGDLFALSTSGVVPPAQDAGDEEAEEWSHPDKGGVIQVFETSEEMFLDDDDAEGGYDEVKFVKKYRRWEMKDTNEEVDDLKFSPSGRYLAVASHDNHIYLYDVRLSFEVRRGGAMVKTGKCVGHSSFVQHVDWSIGGDMLMSNSGDYEQLYWDLSGNQFMGDVRDKNWDTWTCVLGFEVMGIWQDGMDGTDINALHRSHNGNFSVMSGDDGLVYLFNHPVVINEAPHRAFRGHSSHVENVRFLADDKRVVSAGGADRSMMQWKTHGITAPSSHFKKSKAMAKRQVPPPMGGVTGTEEPQEINAPKLEMHLSTLKATHKLNENLLKDKDREILYLKQQLALKSAGIKTAAGGGGGGAASKHRPLEKITVSKDQLEREYKKVARKGKLRISEFKAFLTNIGFAKSQDVAQRLFNAFDLNRDGELEAEEFITGLSLMLEEDSDRKLEFIFRMLDKDGHGGISETEIRTFTKGFFVLGVDAVSIILKTIEGLVGTTGAHAYRANLVDQAEDLMRRKIELMTEKAIIMADANNDGRIGFDEFRQWVDGDDQLLRWVESLGNYWAGLSQEAKNDDMDPRHISGKADAERKLNVVKVQEYLATHMAKIKLEGEGSLVAALDKYSERDAKVDAKGTIELFAHIKCHNHALAKKVHEIYAGEGKTDGDMVPIRSILCGVSLLCAQGATAAQKLSFAFTIFDADRSGELSENEVRSFFELLRGPATKIIDDAMKNFFATCGFEEEFRGTVSDLTRSSLDLHIDAVAKDAMLLDVNNDKVLARDEFMAWGKKNRHVGKWIDNLSRFVISGLGDLHITDFDEERDWA